MSGSKTPLSDLLLKQAEKPSGDGQGSSGNGFNWILTLLLAGLLAFLVWNKFADKISPNPIPDDGRGQVEPVPKGIGKTLIFVHERNPQSIEHDLLLREMPKFCGDRKLQFRALDDDLTEPVVQSLVAFAASKGINGEAFVVLTDQGDKPYRVIKWPSDVAGLKELFK
jgi:hypothetical protein